MRASGVVKRQSMVASRTFRLCIQGVTSRINAGLSGMRWSKQINPYCEVVHESIPNAHRTTIGATPEPNPRL